MITTTITTTITKTVLTMAMTKATTTIMAMTTTMITATSTLSGFFGQRRCLLVLFLAVADSALSMLLTRLLGCLLAVERTVSVY